MPKKIVFVIESLQLGGSEKSLVTLLQHLSPQEWHIDLIVFHKGGIFEKQVPKYVNIIYQEFPKLNIFERIYYKWKRSRYAKTMHSQQMLWSIIDTKLDIYPSEYDIAIAYSQGFATYYTAAFIQAPVKYTWMNVDYIKAGYDFKQDVSSYQAFDAMVCVSSLVQNSLQELMSMHAMSLPTYLIPDILDISTIRSLSSEHIDYPENNTVIQILTVGRLMEEKGLLLAVQACKILLEKGYDVVWSVVGEGAQRLDLEKAIIANNLQHHFYLLGAKDNPYPYMKKCDIYAQTSFYEGLGLTLMEAASLGKAIVTTDFPTAYNTITNNKTGLIVEPKAELIAEAISKYIIDRNFAITMQNGLIEDFQTEDSYSKVIQLFNLR